MCTSPFLYGYNKYLSLPKDPQHSMQLWSREGNSAREFLQLS